MHNALPEAEIDYVSTCRCLQILEDAPAISEIVLKLLVGSTEQKLLAYQVAFDLVESDNQALLLSVAESIPTPAAPAEAAPAEAAPTEAAPAEGAAAEPAAVAPAAAAPAAPENAPEDYWDRVKQLRLIVADGFPVDLALDFLFKNSSTDYLILQNMKTAGRC
jgi:26S proteasome regulatory subunit N2